MSATIAAEMYTEYFEVPRSPIYVSARRFPIREYYLEDLDQVVSLQGEEKTLLGTILANSAKQQGSNIPMPHEIKSLHHLAVYLTIAIGKPRTSVLIFVAGMNDIIHISELIEKIKIPGKKFTCLPIHGEIPIEDQMVVFQPAGPNEVKVIVATNVAESSITLPDVDSKYSIVSLNQLHYLTIRDFSNLYAFFCRFIQMSSVWVYASSSRTMNTLIGQC
jgi:HrpA-like RNA helicase